MNLKHPYEKHLAEKLVQLPPPGDPDQNWQQMKALLDEDMPRGGGAFGASRWIIPGIIILAIGTGIWFGGKQFLPMQRGDQSMAGTINKTHNNKSAVNDSKTTNANVNDQATAAAGNSKTGTPASTNGAVPATSETTKRTPSETNQKELVAGNAPAAATTDLVTTTAAHEDPGDQKVFTRSKKKEPPALAVTDKKANQPATNITNKNNTDRKKIYAKKNNRRKENNNRLTNPSVPGNDLAAGKKDHLPKTVSEPTIDPAMAAAEEEEEEENHFVSLRSVRMHKPSIRPESKPMAPVKESPVDIIVDYTGTSIITPSGVLQRNYTYYTSTDLFPELAQKRGSRKSGRGYEAYHTKAFAIGISLPLGFPLGDQEPLAYNRQAGANTISDYIPSPHIQYHVNGRTYFQTQIQFSSPQFIRPILLYKNVESTTQPGIEIQNLVYARKLYYFNLPVSVYHSPMRNFYMGTGLQFSSMLSGVALSEQRRHNMANTNDDYILKQNYTRFAGDSLSQRFNNSEVRLLLDMNYFWNRFVVGLQYNQAFNNYVSFQMNPASPYTFDKNKSLQFYLRYNIWEDRKRKPKRESVLSLK